MKKIVFPLLAVFLSIIGALLAAELFIRIFYPQPDAAKWYVSDKRYGSVLKKNFYQEFHYYRPYFVMKIRTNRYGFRGADYDLTDPLGKKILLLGDSFTFGHGLNIEDIFATKLEGLLEKSGKKYIVVNAGVSGWGTLQETAFARDNFKLFNPDFIVLTFCGNDPLDDTRFIRKESDLQKGMVYIPGKSFFRDHSHLFRYIREKFFSALYSWKFHKPIKAGVDAQQDDEAGVVLTKEDWERTTKIIKDFHRDYLEFNPKGVLLLQATSPMNEFTRQHLKKLSNGKDLIYVDLYNETAAVRPGDRYLSYDNHWTPRMHSISANRLAEEIIRIENGK